MSTCKPVRPESKQSADFFCISSRPQGRRRQYLSYVNTLVFRRRQIPTRREIADLRQEYPNLSTIQFSWFRFNNQMLSMDTFEGCEVRLYGRAVAPEGEGAEEEVVGGLVFMCYQDALAILLEREIGLFGPEKRFKLESLCLRDTRYAPRDPLRIEWEALSEQQQSDIKSVLQDVVTLRLPRLPVDTILLSLLPLFPNLLTLSIYWSAPVESEGALAYNLGMLEAFKKYKHESGVKLSTLAVQLPYGFNGGDEISKRLDRGISLVDK